MIDIRTITDDEVATYSRTMATGFDAHLTDLEIEQRRSTIDVTRTHAAFDNDHDGLMVGTARSFPTELTVPGGSVAAGAVTNVTVMPTHRRRGALSAMMRAQLDDIAGRDEPVAILIASESTIYGRFGYGPATWNVTLEIETARGQFAQPGPEGSSLRVVDRDEIRRVAPVLYERFRAEQPGAISRIDWAWDVQLGVIETRYNKDARNAFHVLHPDGYLTYNVDEKWDERHPASTLRVGDMVALTPEAYEALWRFVLGHDLKARVVAEDRPSVEPLPWLLADPRRVRQKGRSDFLWVRVLDVPAALAARTYEAADRLVLDVVDRFRPAGGGRFVLDSGDGTCSPTTEAPDLTIDSRDVGAAYLGGTPLWPAAAAGRVQEHTDGAVARADRMFLTAAPPWCNTWF